MKLQVSPRAGTPHQVELSGPEVVVGRDPSCDLVLSDERCSRRHAVIADEPEGLSIQDAGSSNGIWVNGRHLRRSRLRAGDEVRVGDTVLTVLSEAAETILAPAPALRDARDPDRTRAPTVPPGPPPVGGPAAKSDALATLTVLTVLWTLWAPTWVIAGLLIAWRTDAGLVGSAVAVGAGVVLGAFGGILAVGLRTRAPWARHLQIVAAGGGLLVCPLTFASVTVLIYMLRDDVRAAFEGGPGGGAGEAEITFALSLLGMLALGLVLTGAALFLLTPP
jgi:hypothetical protein